MSLSPQSHAVFRSILERNTAVRAAAIELGPAAAAIAESAERDMAEILAIYPEVALDLQEVPC